MEEEDQKEESSEEEKEEEPQALKTEMNYFGEFSECIYCKTKK